ncbi:TonB-dependent receptor [Hyphomicrobium sp. D-2]|uniref:TonB-dependent receptor domain-containing protein n=1 Tax=Hyphomicrobium sp. D-2 TaxID=3041621 RepID=UPI0024582F49|nr:TonB-dependent receptor [Hyphomicrobium sp. D-2]MDH4982127.1 TonB-dependent receptor [Hyphomicrobium sp. D-2]
MRIRRSAGVSARRNRRWAGVAPLLSAATALTIIPFILDPASAVAQTAAQTRSYSIPAGSLPAALNRFAETSQIQLVYSGETTRGLNTLGLSGTYTAEQALGILLGGTGLTYRFTSAGTVTIENPAAPASIGGASVDGAIALDTIDVSGGSGAASDEPYVTSSTASYISAEQIERYRGTSPADILKNAPGIFSGESRNSGGLDVNIRGMQGMGRVAVSVDGAQNATTVYRGYQGIANRSFIDPDFIGGIEIDRGPNMGPGGASAIGGTVALRTLNADDIVPAGQSIAARVKVEGTSNTSDPWTPANKTNAVALNGTPGLEYSYVRPGVSISDGDSLSFGSTSTVFAGKSENIDFVAGFSRRRVGNYHAGKNGDGASKKVDCDPAAGRPCNNLDWYKMGLTLYLPGEEVLNTSQDSYSTLLKSTVRLGNDQTLDVGYSYFSNMYGETYPWLTNNNFNITDQRLPSLTRVSNYTARYRWNPDNDLIDLKWNTWLAKVEDDSQVSVGDPARKFTDMWGVDLSNTSLIETDFGKLKFQYGASHQSEETGPRDDYTRYNLAPPREGVREESAVFLNSQYAPVDWLKFDGGVRYHVYESRNKRPGNTDEAAIDDAMDYSAGVTLEPVKGWQLFANYKEASRLPSLFEASGGFMTLIDPNLAPERLTGFELGTNLSFDRVLRDDDAVRLKLAYFNNDIKDYINRDWVNWMMLISNIDAAKFAGYEMSGRYDIGGFSAEVSGTYYTNVEFCRTSANCKNSSLAEDYATNQVPPKYSGSLTLSQRLLDDKLLVSGRVTHVGPRAAAAETPAGGANPFIGLIKWKPYTLFDLNASYQWTDSIKFHASVENLTDIYYVDPLNLAAIPSPGRTIRIGATTDLSAAPGSWSLWSDEERATYNWTGLYAGVHGGAFNAHSELRDFWPHRIIEMTDRHRGVQAGINHHFANDIVAGIEVDYTSLKGSYAANSVAMSYGWTASARARLGMAFDRALLYGTGGWAYVGSNSGARSGWGPLFSSVEQSGWTLGAGAEYAVFDHWTVKGEYSFINVDGEQGSDKAPNAFTRIDKFSVGVNYKF